MFHLFPLIVQKIVDKLWGKCYNTQRKWGCVNTPPAKVNQPSGLTSGFSLRHFNYSTRGSYNSTARCQAIPQLYGGLAFFMTNALLKQDLRTLINSHLFCVDNLSDTEIRERLTRDGPPSVMTGNTYSAIIGSPIPTR